MSCLTQHQVTPCELCGKQTPSLCDGPGPLPSFRGGQPTALSAEQPALLCGKQPLAFELQRTAIEQKRSQHMLEMHLDHIADSGYKFSVSLRIGPHTNSDDQSDENIGCKSRGRQDMR